MAVTVEELCARHHVDRAHARHVAAMSLALFDRFPEIHRLPAERRRLLEIAGILHNIAFASDPERHDVAGRDLILAATIAGVGREERDMLACTTRFHRKRAKPGREPVFRALPKRLQKETLALAALLRVGDALDYSQTQTSRILSRAQPNGVVQLVIDGPHADEEAARANRKADLWGEVFARPLAVVTAREAAAPRPAARAKGPAARLKRPGVRSDDPVSEAGRKVLALHFAQFLHNEPGARAGRDSEPLHRMRTATRRLRAALRLFGPYFPPREARRFEKGLRRATRALGPVRDLDVFLSRAERQGALLAKSKRESLEPLLDFWRGKRAAARRKMLRYLDGVDFANLKRDFARLGDEVARLHARWRESPVAKPKPRRRLVRHVAPAILWEAYLHVRSYETVLEGAPIRTLHMLRIECKRLRYALEALGETLGPAADALIAEAKNAQDHLGELHDADVAIQLVRGFLKRRPPRRPRQVRPPKRLEGVSSFLAACEHDVREKTEGVPALWARLTSPDFRRRLAEAAAAI